MTYKILLVPSSEDERHYDEHASNFDEAVALGRGHDDSAIIYNFSSDLERNAFIAGVKAMSGYQGDGFYYTKDEQ